MMAWMCELAINTVILLVLLSDRLRHCVFQWAQLTHLQYNPKQSCTFLNSLTSVDFNDVPLLRTAVSFTSHV